MKLYSLKEQQVLLVIETFLPLHIQKTSNNIYGIKISLCVSSCSVKKNKGKGIDLYLTCLKDQDHVLTLLALDNHGVEIVDVLHKALMSF